MYFNEAYHNYSLPGSDDTEDIFKFMSTKVKVTDSISKKTHFFGGDRWFALKEHLVLFVLPI